MKKSDQKKIKETFSGSQNNVLPKLDQEQVPFLYIAMKEPSEEYKKALASERKLYRLIKVKKQ